MLLVHKKERENGRNLAGIHFFSSIRTKDTLSTKMENNHMVSSKQFMYLCNFNLSTSGTHGKCTVISMVPAMVM